MSFSPDFSHNSIYSPETGFKEIRFAGSAPVLEIELKEIQEITREETEAIILNAIGDNVLLTKNSMSITNGTFEIEDAYVIVNGSLIYISYMQVDTVDGDSIYLDVWEEELSSYDDIHKWGNQQESLINVDWVDDRIGEEISKRIQVQFDLTKSDYSLTNYVKLGENSNGSLINKIKTIDNLEEHLDDLTNPHEVTTEQIGAETPAGAQSKADSAESSAKAYTDTHEGKSNPHSITTGKIGAETPSGAQSKANTAESSAKEYAENALEEEANARQVHVNDSTIHLNEENVEDVVNGLLTAGSDINLSYDDTGDQLTISVDTSNLDADTLDSLESSQFLRSDVNDTFEGRLTNIYGIKVRADEVAYPYNIYESAPTDFLVLGGRDGSDHNATSIVMTADVVDSASTFGTRLTQLGRDFHIQSGPGTHYPYLLTLSGGKVGINKADPQHVLDVDGSIYSNNNRVLTTEDEGSGNGIDADTLDGKHYIDIQNLVSTHTDDNNIHLNEENVEDIVSSLLSAGANINLNYDDTNNNLTVSVDTSNLDADTLDSLESSQFLRSDQNDTINGNLTVEGEVTANSLNIYRGKGDYNKAPSAYSLGIHHHGTEVEDPHNYPLDVGNALTVKGEDFRVFQLLVGWKNNFKFRVQNDAKDDDWTKLYEIWHTGNDNKTGNIYWHASDNPPNGYLVCDGSAVDRDDYSRLFNVIGVKYGNGDGAGTFNLPDLRSEFVRGSDEGLGINGGHDVGTWQDHEIESHRHSMDSGDSTNTNVGYVGEGHSLDSAGLHTNYEGGAETRPRNIALLPVIKY